MSPTRSRFRLSFNAKVLIPVITIIVLLVSFALWIMNIRITRQFHQDATQKLITAGRIFENLETMRSRHLLLRSARTPNDPRFRATAQLAEPNTMKFLLQELIEEINCDYISYRDLNGAILSIALKDPRMDVADQPDFGLAAANLALNGKAVPDMDSIDDSIYRLAAIPVSVGNDTIGVLTIAERFSEESARTFFDLTGCNVTLFIRQQPVLSSLRPGQNYQSLGPRYSATHATSINEVEIGGEHVLATESQFEALDQSRHLHYALILSYEQTLQALRSVQLLLLGAGLIGILASSAIIGIIIGRITNPLRALRKSAEAVGRNDFTQKVDVISSDELGEFAAAFNQMVDNLRQSADELQTTIGALKNTQAQLMQSEKLSALGEFIAGVTHELNNPLCTIIGFSELLKEQHGGEKIGKELDMIADAADRCHKIVQNLLSFARQRPPERKAASVNEIIDATIKFMSYELRTSNVTVTREFDRQMRHIMADAHQLQQVFLNLINNARQAIIGARDKGHIFIRTRVSGDDAVIEIADDGPGIPPENISRIFDPFFTTKEVGKGTGLGLSVSYGIIREHGGNILVRSQPGEGTTFEIRLPLIINNTSMVVPEKKTEANANPLLGEGRRVLVLDDETEVLKLVTSILESNSFVVEAFTDGHDALRRLRTARFDVILCDWRMPGMTGKNFYELLREVHPSAATRLVFMTGDVLNEQTTSYFDDNGKLCIHKPFSLDEFRAVIMDVIN